MAERQRNDEMQKRTLSSSDIKMEKCRCQGLVLKSAQNEFCLYLASLSNANANFAQYSSPPTSFLFPNFYFFTSLTENPI